MSRWEEREREEAALDEPVTITERQYRSLKRGATLGLCALILAVLGTGLAVWNFVAGPKNSQASPAVAQTAPAESSTTETATPAPAPTPDSVRSAAAPPPAATPAPAPSATAAKPVVKPVVTAHASARHASKAAASAATARAQRSAMGSATEGQKPQTMQASDLISKPTPAAPSPVAAQSAKKDTTGVHK